MTLPRRPAALFAGLVLAGCGHSPPTVLHTLVATPAAPSPYAGPPVRVEAVRLPPALDRLELLRETGPGRYTVEESDRWAAPPSRLVRQALEEGLALRLPGAAVTGSPGVTPATAVSVDVLAFTAGPPMAALTATWTRSCRPGEAQGHAAVQLQAPSLGRAPEALSVLTGLLADRIAADLAARPDVSCAAAPPPTDPGRR